MPSPPKIQRSGSREKEEEYAVFMHPIPHNFRWQEIKDIARTYCAAPVRQADTVEPSHDLGYVLVAGLRSALKAYQGFCENGIAGRKVRVSLNGPYSSRKNFTNAVNHGQADKLICNNLAEFEQHQSHQAQFQAVDPITRPGTQQSGPGTSAIFSGYTNCNNIFAAQPVQFAYPNIMYSTATPTQLVASPAAAPPLIHSQPQSNIYTSSAIGGGHTPPPLPPPPVSTQLPRGRNQQSDNLNASSYNSASQQTQQSRSRTGGRTPRGVRIINLPADVSKGELNKFLKRKTGGSVEPEATRIGRNGKFAIAQTVFKKASCAGVAVSEIKSFGRWPVRVEFDEKYEFRTPPPRGGDVGHNDGNDDDRGPTPSSSSSGEGEPFRRSPRSKYGVRGADADVEADAEADDGPVVVDGAKGSRHKRPATESEAEEDDDSSSDEISLLSRRIHQI